MSKQNKNYESNNNVDMVELKRDFTDQVMQQIQRLSIDDRDKNRKKNAEALQKYTMESEENFNEFTKIVRELIKAIPDYANTIVDSKLDKKEIQYGHDMLKFANQHFSELNKKIQSKNVTLKVNQYIKKTYDYIIKTIKQSKADIDAYNKSGCCGGGSIKKKLIVEIPQNYYNFLNFLETLSNAEVVNAKQEYPYLDPDFKGLEIRIKNLIEEYFPTDIETKVIYKEQIVYKDRVETKYVPVEGKSEEDFIVQGHEHIYGISMPQQIKKGLEFYVKEENKQNVKAYNCLGQIYLEGKVVEQDLRKAYNYYVKSSDRNDAEGRYRIGQFYERGYINQIHNQNLSQNELIKRAMEFYQQAADLKHQDAKIDLGYIYENGVRDQKNNYIVVQDLSLAKSYYDGIDTQNFPRASNNLGTLALKQDNKKGAFFNFQKADSMGYPQGSMNLGICYLKGIGTEIDLIKAMELLKKAAKKGNQEAKLKYCYYLLQKASDTDMEKEYFQAATYLREILTVDPQNSEAYLYLGFLHELGLGVAVDYKSALLNYQQSAMLKNDKALTKMGDIYFSGSLLNRDMKRAIEYYHEAAEYGNTTALINLGVKKIVNFLLKKRAIYEEGYDGQQPDYEKAYEFYLQAANGGSSEAYTHIGLMIEMGRKKDCQASESYEAYLKASKRGNLNSLQILKDKVDALNHYDVDVEFKNEQEEEQFRILKQNQMNILQSHRQVSEIHFVNKQNAYNAQQVYDTPTAAAGLHMHNNDWENQQLNYKKY